MGFEKATLSGQELLELFELKQSDSFVPTSFEIVELFLKELKTMVLPFSIK